MYTGAGHVAVVLLAHARPYGTCLGLNHGPLCADRYLMPFEHGEGFAVGPSPPQVSFKNFVQGRYQSSRA